MAAKTRGLSRAINIGRAPTRIGGEAGKEFLQRYFQELEIRAGDAESLPFNRADVTVGTENEFQATVIGTGRDVDLPQTIEQSRYFVELVQAGSPRAGALQAYLNDEVWENSRVRVRLDALHPAARRLVERDLLADKRDPSAGRRGDADTLLVNQGGESALRVPISYLLKLALADVLGESEAPALVRRAGEQALGCFLNDNTSPEIISTHITPLSRELGLGRAVARENAQRFLMSQLLIAYANDKLGLREHGEEASLYFSALPPERVRRLNTCLPAPLYRELFMNPCLSGWDRGEDKHGYMHVCHEALTASQGTARARLASTGLAKSRVTDSGSDTSLANNGTHISLGSLRLTRALDTDPARYRPMEKFAGDLAIKIVEHFLPLFVGTYSAAPYRIGVADFRPEKILSFLPHQLGEADLRFLWRGWRKKALNALSGLPQAAMHLGNLLGLRGDYTPDFRLLSYFVALPGTDAAPALDGSLGNAERLKADLARRGVYDARMTLYLPYRLREFATMGFSGFEGRYYSVFHSLEHDLGRGVELQTLVTALAYKYIALGAVDHTDIPDTPAAESERRTFFFGTAIGVPTIYLRKGTSNRFLRRILASVPVKQSKRHPSYHKVSLAAYRLALVRILEEDAADLVEAHGLRGTLLDLKQRLSHAGASAADRITRSVLQQSGAASPLQMRASDFNAAAETYYRNTLRQHHTEESFEFFIRETSRMDAAVDYTGEYRAALRTVLDGRPAGEFAQAARRDLRAGTIDARTLRKLIQLLLLSIARDSARSAGKIGVQ